MSINIFYSRLLIVLAIVGSVLTESPSWCSTVVGIMDTPVDYSHPALQKLLDDKVMRESLVTDADGEQVSWYDANQTQLSKIRKNLELGLTGEQLALFRAIYAERGTPGRESASISMVMKGILKYLVSPKYRANIALFGSYLHGTHVTSVAMKSLTDVKFVNFFIGDPLSEIAAYFAKPEEYQNSVHFYIDSVTQVLRKNHVRVMNISGDLSERAIYNKIMSTTGILRKTFFRQRTMQQVRRLAEIIAEESKRLIEDNPETVFVLAAGNDGIDITDEAIQTKNVVYVASVDEDGSLATYSNYSATRVHIGARGTGVVGALADGGDIGLTGTSMAAPVVTNSLIQIFSESPDLSVYRALQKLYLDDSYTNRSLANKLIKGRVLRARGPYGTCSEMLSKGR